MSTARERVAEAICGETAAGEMFPWSTLNERDRDSWRQVADAAIAAHLEALSDSLFAPESLQQVRDRLALIESTPCMCVDEPHDNALHDLAHDDVPVLLRLIERLQPVRVTTAEELDALPVGTVVLDDMGDVLQRHNPAGGWLLLGYIGLHLPVLPALVLWTPEADQ